MVGSKLGRLKALKLLVLVLKKIQKRVGLAWLMFVFAMSQWSKRLREKVRVSHREFEKAHPFVKKYLETNRILREGYHAPGWISMGTKFFVGTVHTVAHNIIRRVRSVAEVKYDRELFQLDCGATVGLDWLSSTNGIEAIPKTDQRKPIVLLHHGLAGCSRSHYIQSIVSKLNETQQFRVCVMVARGCGDVPLTTPYGFTASGYNDYGQVVQYLKRLNPDAHIYGVGYSLGAGLVSNYVGRSGRDCQLSGAVVLSPCWDFLKTTPYFEIWSRKFLASSLLEYSHRNKESIAQHPHLQSVQAFEKKASEVVNTRDFDHRFIVPLHGYKDVDDYYHQSSPILHAHDIHVPTLALSADDDPVCSVEGADIMERKKKHGPGLVVARTHRGGHVSWAEGILGYDSWMDKVILEWIEMCHSHHEQTEKMKPIRRLVK